MLKRSSEQLRQRIADACLDLIRIPSVTGDEQAIADFVEKWAQSLAQPVTRLGNALFVGNPGDTRPTIALVGHLDTVPAHSTDLPARQEGDRIVGLGTSDMKGSLAVMQALYENLPLQTLPFNLMLIFYDREEGAYADNGLQPLLDRYDSLRNIDLAIAMEPTDNTLQLGCMGGIHARITFTGKSAHSARPWQGENAIHKAGPFLCELQKQTYKEVNVEGLIFRDAYGITLASGGRARNVVPDKFELNLNYRFAPVAPIQTAIDNAIAAIRSLAQGAEVEITDISPPGPVPTNNPIFEHLRNLAQLEVQPKQAWTDVARLAAHGIDAINFGPGMTAQAHQAGEWISLDAMVQAYEVLAKVLSEPLSR